MGSGRSGTEPENYQQLWIPVGFAHGFLTLSALAEVQYKASGFWNSDCERSYVGMTQNCRSTGP